MAQTAAERQAAYRARRATAGNDGNGERRLSMWVTTESDLALARQAFRYWGCKPEPRKFPSLQIQPSHDGVQVDALSTAAERVMPVQVDMAHAAGEIFLISASAFAFPLASYLASNRDRMAEL